jgi:hypothetical protein
MTVLEVEGEGDDRRLHLSGDWSLTAMAQIEAQLRNIPAGMRGNLACDWSRAEAPGIGPAWALLLRLAELGANLNIRHTEYPPHYLPQLSRIQHRGGGAHGARAFSGSHRQFRGETLVKSQKPDSPVASAIR